MKQRITLYGVLLLLAIVSTIAKLAGVPISYLLPVGFWTGWGVLFVARLIVLIHDHRAPTYRG